MSSNSKVQSPEACWETDISDELPPYGKVIREILELYTYLRHSAYSRDYVSFSRISTDVTAAGPFVIDNDIEALFRSVVF